MESPRPRPSVALLVGLTIFYLLACRLGLLLASVNRSATPVWPGSGIAFAAFLLFGSGAWPAILLGAFLVNMTTAGTVATSIGIALGNTLEGYVGARLVSRWAGGRRVFERPQTVFAFVALAGMLSTCLSATIGVVSLGLGGFLDWSRIRPIWFTWWLGDLGGDLVVAPPLVLWMLQPALRMSRERLAEAAGLLLLLLACAWLVFGGLPVAAGAQPYPLEFLCIPFLIWAAFRFGPRETSTAIVVLGSIAVCATLRGLGPFHRPDRNESLLLLQAFIAVNSVMALALAAVVLERGRARAALTQQAADLARSNSDLRQFANVASHDLREPLRVVTNYVELLAQRYRGRLDADADAFIRHTVEAASRMRDLIDGVLAMARAGRSEAGAGLIDCGEALDRAIANLQVAIEENRAVIRREALPSLRADPVQLSQVFQNLIANALKFKGASPPEIRIGARREGNEWVLSVADNGIGVSPDYSGRIFSLFRRLHTREEIPGVGVGLAICRNIVERLGGRIWVDSAPGKGSTFHFSLPDA